MILIHVFNEHVKHRIRHKGTIDAIRSVVKNERVGFMELNIIYIGDKQMTNLNTIFLNHRYTTDVISFSLSDSKNRIEGEVYVNLDQARRQAKEYKVSFREEYLRLVIHGVLHLCGYTDKKQSDKKQMTEKENYYLSMFKSKNKSFYL